MSDDRQSWPILSANKIGQQKSVVCHAKNRPILSVDKIVPDFIVQRAHVLFWAIKSANSLDIGQYGNCLQRETNICFSYLFCLLLYDVSFRSSDAEKNNASIILRFAFCCCVSVKLADIVYEVANDEIGRVS